MENGGKFKERRASKKRNTYRTRQLDIFFISLAYHYMLSTKTIAYLLAYITCSLSILTACSTPQIDTSPRGI